MLVAEAELAREFALVVEQQAFLGAAGGHVQREANPLDQGLRLHQALGLACGDQALLRQRGKGWCVEQTPPQPQDRLRVAQGILRNLGFTPTWPEHDEKCILHPKNAWNRCFGFNYICDAGCPRRSNPPPTWPEGVSGEIFDLAYQLACAVQDRRAELTADALNRYDREKRERRRTAAA